MEHAIGAGVAAHHAMPSPRKQEEVALGERSCRQHPVGRRRRRVVLAAEDQGGNGAGDGLLLHRGYRLVRVYLTERGREVQTLLPALLRTATEEVLAGLTQEERIELVRLLKRVQKNLVEEG